MEKVIEKVAWGIWQETYLKKRGVSYSYRTAQPHTFATFLSWRIKRELVVKDLPRANVGISFYSNENILEFLCFNRAVHQRNHCQCHDKQLSGSFFI